MQAIGYARFSPRPNAQEAQSLLVQRDRITAYCQFRQLELVDVLDDPETSGRTEMLADREGGAALLAQVGRGKITHVVAYRLDRLFRNLDDGAGTLRRWEKAGVSLHLIAEGGECVSTSTAFGKLMIRFRLMMTEFEAEQTAERTSDSMIRHQARNRRMSARVPYGKALDYSSPLHESSGLPTRMVDVPEEQSVIARIECLSQEGYGPAQIAGILNSQGTLNRGNLWHHAVVSRILKRRQREIELLGT